MVCIPGQATEIPGSDVACETLTVRGCLTVAGVDITGGGSGVDIEDEGVPIAGNPHSTLNLTGSGVTATDAGGGVVDIAIPGPEPVLNFDHLEDFINSEGSIQRTLGAAVVTLLSNPSGSGYYIGVIQAQAPVPGDEATIFVQYYVPTNPIAGQQTIDLGGGPFSMEARGNLLHVPDAIDDENITILGVGFGSALAFGVGVGLFGNANYWAIGAAGPDIDTGVPATTAITKWRIDHDAVTDTATWYIDGVLVATVVGAGVSGVTLGAIVGNLSNTTGTCGFLLDYMRIQYTTIR